MRISISARGIADTLRWMTGYGATRRDRMARALEREGRRAVQDIVLRYRRGGTTAERTAVRTGRLMGSYGYQVERRPVGLSVGVEAGSAALVYAGVHEGIDAQGRAVDETVIRPRRGQYLAIPLPAALTGAGVERRPPRAYRNTFVRKGIIFQRRGRTIVPLYRLARSVRVPARPALRRIAPELVSRVAEEAARVYAGA